MEVVAQERQSFGDPMVHLLAVHKSEKVRYKAARENNHRECPCQFSDTFYSTSNCKHL